MILLKILIVLAILAYDKIWKVGEQNDDGYSSCY